MLAQHPGAATPAAGATSTTLPAPGRATVTLVPGDGIGPEISAAVTRVLAAAGARVDWETCDAGERVFSAGLRSALPRETLESIARNSVLLKGPLATAVGGGGKSANVTLRKHFETYANVRPARELPGVPTPYAGRGIDFVVVRENVEDLYAGIEHMQSAEVAQALKIVTRRGSEKIHRFAFELARSQGRTSIHCATKANILKLTEGLFKRVFEEVAAGYPGVRAEHLVVDNCAHLLALQPERFEVIVATNLHGDILSDLASGLVGGLGFAPSANYGDEAAIFEAVHGTAPDIAGRDLANPSALLLSAVLMLRHLGQLDVAARVENALLAVLERGRARTADFARGPHVGTHAFADAVIEALGAAPQTLALREHRPLSMPRLAPRPPAPAATATGVDVFIESRLEPEALAAELLHACEGLSVGLTMISNRGLKVWPAASCSRADLADVFRCRFVGARPGAPVAEEDLALLLYRIGRTLRWMHVEKLSDFAGQRGYTLAQGEA